jgi:DNA-binding SARP family transcriptional activator
MEFRLLGAFEVWDRGQPVEIAGSKRRALLALLVLRANEVVRSELLVDELWGERPPRNAGAALHNHVSRLRKALGAETIASREWGYVLRADPAEIDLRRFEGLLTEAESLAARERASKLTDALGLWRGPPLADLVNEPALQQDIARLEELRLGTLERRIDADLEAGRNAELIGELETLVARQPLREHLRWLLILALYRAGRQAEALEVYRETRRVLTEELGLEPSPALKELEQAILRQDPALEANAPPPPTEPPAGEPERRRRRLPPVALLALLALGLAGAATAIALVRPEKGTSSGTPAGTIYALPPMVTGLATETHTATVEQKTTAKKHPTTTRPAGHTSGPTSTTSKHLPSTRFTTTSAPPAHKKHRQRGAPPEPVTIADNFADGTLDPLTWSTWSSGTGTSYTQANGEAVFSIAADSTFDPQWHGNGTSIGTTCKVSGPFDVRVDFSLLQWPQANGAAISLTAFKTQPVDMINRSTTTQYDGYSSWPTRPFVPDPRGGLPLADLSGRLRMSRSDGWVRNYIWHHGGWKELGKAPLPGEVWVGLGIGTSAGVWQQQDVAAAFDNFVLKAAHADCPAGSNPQ